MLKFYDVFFFRFGMKTVFLGKNENMKSVFCKRFLFKNCVSGLLRVVCSSLFLYWSHYIFSTLSLTKYDTKKC